MEQIFYLIALITYSIFIIRFTLSWIGGDFEIEGGDLDLGDIVSFKGLTHFLMGSSGWLSVKSFFFHSVGWYDYLVAFFVGIIFMGILFLLYKFMFKLEYKPSVLSGKQLIGKSAEIYLHCKKEGEFYKYLITVDNGLGTIEVPARSYKFYSIGDMTTITDYKDSYYIIL